MNIISDETYTEYEEWARYVIDAGCIWRRKPGEPRLKGKAEGTWYSWQFYMRRAMFDPSFAHAISSMFLYRIHKEIGHFNFQLAGLETASTPLLSCIPLVAKYNGIELSSFSVRKHQKEYGLRNWIEGSPDPNLPVMLIDDLCNSQNSMFTAKQVIENTYEKDVNLKIFDHAFSIVNKVNREDKVKLTLDKHLGDEVKMIYLYDLDSFNLRV